MPWLAHGRGDPVVIETLNAANNPDLRAYKRQGGKLVLVQGWDDQSVMPQPTLDCYETMQRTMGGPATTRDFARLIMVPGMDHCAGGKGAYAINYMKALEDWVERGQAPDALLAHTRCRVRRWTTSAPTCRASMPSGSSSRGCIRPGLKASAWPKLKPRTTACHSPSAPRL